MSGSSGGGNYGVGGGSSGSGSGSGGFGGSGSPGQPPCEVVKISAQLASPQPSIVSILTIGEALDVVVATLQGVSVVQIQRQGALVGGITGPDAVQLRSCIAQGHVYTATVQVINGGQVRVLIEHF